MTQSLNQQFLIALDVGGGSVKSGRVSLGERTVQGLRNDPIDSYGDADTILDALAAAIGAQAAHSAPQDIAGVAFGFPGPMDYDKGICYIQTPGVSYASTKTKFGSIYGVDVGAALRKRLHRPDLVVRFRNDAEAAILGEAIYGAGASYRRVVGVTLGTGLGSAFLIDGVPQTSGAGVPESGWFYPLLTANGSETGDDAFSTRGLLKRFHAAGLTFETVKAAAAAAATAAPSNPSVAQVFAQWGNDMGEFVGPWLRDFQAQAFLMVGGIAQAFALFGPSLQARISAPAITGTLGAAAPLLGAAALFQD